MTILAKRLHDLGYDAEIGMVITEPRTGNQLHVTTRRTADGRNTWYLIGEAIPLADAHRIDAAIEAIKRKLDGA